MSFVGINSFWLVLALYGHCAKAQLIGSINSVFSGFWHLESTAVCDPVLKNSVIDRSSAAKKTKKGKQITNFIQTKTDTKLVRNNSIYSNTSHDNKNTISEL